MSYHKGSAGARETITRRYFISGCLSAGAASVLSGDLSRSAFAAARQAKPRTILLRSA